MKKLLRTVRGVLLRATLEILEKHAESRRTRLIAKPSYLHKKLRRLRALIVLLLRRKAHRDRMKVNARIYELFHSLEERGFDKAAFLRERNIDLSQYSRTSDNN